MRHLLVTNDFPPKVGGIQSYLWELWRRLPSDSFSVLTTRYGGDKEWDAQQPFSVRRTKQWWLLPTNKLVNEINSLVDETKADFVVLDPVVPLGILGPRLKVPYVAIAHGAEYEIPARIPVARSFVERVTNKSVGMIASGAYVQEHVLRICDDAKKPVISVPPGVDCNRFIPLDEQTRSDVRTKYGIEPNQQLVVGVSRLVPRKGFDRLIKAAAQLKREGHSELRVLIAGGGRQRKNLDELIAKLDAPVTMLGRVADDELPGLYGAADVFCMPCHDRWFGLESEGFGIVFAEAGAAGTVAVAGASGGSSEAVLDGETGIVVAGQARPADVASALAKVLQNAPLRSQMQVKGRQRAVEQFSYDHLATELDQFLKNVFG